MDRLTITEALAEIKTINSRIENKSKFIANNIYRQDKMRDPLEKDGGQIIAVAAELQSINDLQLRKIAIRAAIQKVNQVTTVSVKGREKTIADWIVWKREVLPQYKGLLNNLSSQIANVRRDAMNKGVKVAEGAAAKTPDDVIINLNEYELKTEIENLSEVEGTLDGLLSLKNATVFVEF